MARTSKYTREDLIKAAMGLVKGNGFANLSARTLTNALGATAATIFTHFDSMEELNKEVVSRIKIIYDGYIEEGLKMKPPFKGLAMQMLRFARDYPQYYKILFFERKELKDVDVLLKTVGHIDEINSTVMETFHLNEDQARWMYKNLLIYSIGYASLITNNTINVSDEELADNMSRMARAVAKEAHNQSDKFTTVMPSETLNIEGHIDEYLGE